MPPLLGFIRKRDRTQGQADAHAAAEATFHPGLRLAAPAVPKGAKIALYDSWKHPTVVSQLGFAFPRYHQLTGSCVGAGGGNALMLTVCLQALAAANPTKASLVFWPFDYGRCRYNEGDRGPGEGAMGSSFAQTCMQEGVLDAAEQGLPAFKNNDGLVLTSQLEMTYSDGGAQVNTQWLPTAKQFPLGAAAVCKNSQDIKAAVANGYCGSFACDNYIGDASVQGSGADQAVVGYWNGSGGHQQYWGGYWENPTLGPLYAVGNNWPGSTYPTDPGGLPTCWCWVTEAHVDSAMKNLDAEVYAFSALKWFAAQPAPSDLWYV